METLAQRFDRLRARDERALVLFLTAGDQPLDELPALLQTLAEGGADVIEVGLPFSDPFGEGPTIQASSQRSLEGGASVARVLEAVGRAQVEVPLVLMGYYNPILRRGLSRFAQDAREAGVSGVIVSDLIPDEADDWSAACAQAGVDTIFLAAPTSTPRRIEWVARRSTGFVYAVSRTGVTGAENEVPPEVNDLVGGIKALTDKPVCVGFGISRPEHVSLVCRAADGAVVGSALVQRLHEEWQGGAGQASIVRFVQSLKAATDLRAGVR